MNQPNDLVVEDQAEDLDAKVTTVIAGVLETLTANGLTLAQARQRIAAELVEPVDPAAAKRMDKLAESFQQQRDSAGPNPLRRSASR